MFAAALRPPCSRPPSLQHLAAPLSFCPYTQLLQPEADLLEHEYDKHPQHTTILSSPSSRTTNSSLPGFFGTRSLESEDLQYRYTKANSNQTNGSLTVMKQIRTACGAGMQVILSLTWSVYAHQNSVQLHRRL
jgi:hypothetical protein